MESVGIRKLKENLSRYLQGVRRGEALIITDRKKPIAVLKPLSDAGEAESRRLLHLVRENRIVWSGRKPSGLGTAPDTRARPVSDAVSEDRR